MKKKKKKRTRSSGRMAVGVIPTGRRSFMYVDGRRERSISKCGGPRTVGVRDPVRRCRRMYVLVGPVVRRRRSIVFWRKKKISLLVVSKQCR